MEQFKNHTEGNDEMIKKAFDELTLVTREEVQKEIVDKFSREDILEVLDDSNNAEEKPDVLFLVLDILDPKSQSKIWVAQMVIDSPNSDPVVKEEAKKFLEKSAQ